MQYSLFYHLPQRVHFREMWDILFRLAVRLQMDFCSKCAKIGGRWKMFLFPFLEKSKKLLKWTGEHLTTPVNLDEHGATRNTKKAWRIATFLYIGEHRWQMFNGSPKRQATGSNPAGGANRRKTKRFCGGFSFRFLWTEYRQDCNDGIFVLW